MNDLRIEASLKYERLKEFILDSLKNGDFKPGDQIPSQNVMAEKYGVSPGTVREALASLVNDGLLYRIQGKGTFVSELKSKALRIALIIPHLHIDGDIEYSIGYNLVPPLIRYIQDEAEKRDADILLYLDDDDIEHERRNLQKVIDRKVDGLIIFFIGYGENEDYLNRVKESGIPVVMIDRYAENIEVNHVCTDNYKGARKIVEILSENGYTKILYITNSSECSGIKDRLNGYCDAINNLGYKTDVLPRWNPTPLLSNSGEEEQAYKVTIQALKNINEPVGLFANNSVMAAGVNKAINESGINPENIALAYFDKEYFHINKQIFVVTAHQPLEAIGRQAVNILLKKMGDETGLSRISLEPEIEIRQSLSHVL